MKASDHAYAALLADIHSGDLAPGAVLAEVEQAARLGISRTPAREAIGRLTAAGLAVRRSPRVTVVAAVAPADVRRLFELRRGLEETAARLAAERGDADVFAALAGEFAAVRLGDTGALDDYYALISRFDAELDRAVANEYLTTTLGTVRAHLGRFRRLARDNPARLAASVVEHQLIASAIGLHDPDLAAHATHVHLHNALAAILRSLPEENS